MSNDIIPLQPPEFANLVEKVNANCVAVDYFRKSLFNATVRDSYGLRRKKIIYQDNKTIIRVNRSLNQRHRDLFTTLMYEQKSKIQSDGSFYIKTKIYKLAKIIYPDSKNAKHRIKELLDDMRVTDIEVKRGHITLNHTLLGMSYYNDDDDNYMIHIPAQTAKYLIYTFAMSIPSRINQKIVSINDAKLKALISFLLSNKKLENGIRFDTICEKLEIINKSSKSKFKKTIRDSTELLKQFKIKYKDDKFYLKKEIVKFYHALSDEEFKNYELKQEKKTELASLVGKEIVLQDDRYILCGIKPETDKTKDNYNCYNILLKTVNEQQMGIIRTSYTTQEKTIKYIKETIL
jgi:hypothetical protein